MADQTSWRDLAKKSEDPGATAAPADPVEGSGGSWRDLMPEPIEAFGEGSWRKSTGEKRTWKSWITGLSDYEDYQTVARMRRLTRELADTGAIADEQDETWIRDLMAHSERPKTIGAKAQGLVADSLVFAQDFFLGGKVLGTAASRVASRKALQELSANWLSRQYAASMAKAGIKSAATVGAAEVLKKGAGEAGLPIAARTEVAFARDMYQQKYGLTLDEAGDLQAIVEAGNADAAVALYRAGLGTFIEGFTEGIGGHLIQLGPMQRVSAAQHAMADWFVKRGGSVGEFTARVAREGGWDGVVEEWLEERAGDVARGLAPGTQVSFIDAVTPDLDQWGAELLGFAALGGSMRAPGLLMGPRDSQPAEGEDAAQAQPGDLTGQQIEEISSLPPMEAEARMRELGFSPVPETQSTIDAQVQAMIDGRKPAVWLGPDDPAPSEIPGDFRRAELHGGVLLYKDPETLELARDPERFGEALGYGVGAKPEGDTVITARTADGTVVSDIIAPEDASAVRAAAEQLAGEGGTVEERAAEDAINERLVGMAPAPPPGLEESIRQKRGLETVQNVRGAKTIEEARIVARERQERGTDVYFADMPQGTSGAVFREGTILLDSNLQDRFGAESLEAYVFHEGIHEAAKANPAMARRLVNLIVATELGTEARERYAAELERVNSKRAEQDLPPLPPLSEKQLDEEGAALLQEELWLPVRTLLESNPEALAEAVAQEPGFLVRVWEAIKRMLGALGIKTEPAAEKRAREALERVLGARGVANAQDAVEVLTYLARIQELRTGREAPSQSWKDQPRDQAGRWTEEKTSDSTPQSEPESVPEGGGVVVAEMPTEEGLFEPVEREFQRPEVGGEKAQQPTMFDVGQPDDIEGQGVMFDPAAPVPDREEEREAFEPPTPFEMPTRKAWGAPRTVVELVRDLGGIDLRRMVDRDTGKLQGRAQDYWERLQAKQSRGGKKRLPGGLLYGPNSKAKSEGRTIDEMAMALAERGFRPEDASVESAAVSADDLLEWIENELAGQPKLVPDLEQLRIEHEAAQAQPGPEFEPPTEGEEWLDDWTPFAVAFHGSPHEFDRFSTDKIGTGEGAQAYGWGLYFASKKEIAEYYKEELSDLSVRLPSGVTMPARTYGHFEALQAAAESALIELGVAQDKADLYSDLILQEFSEHDTFAETATALRADAERYGEQYAEAADALDRLVEAGLSIGRGAGYEVSLAPAEDEWLLWDEPLSRQSAKVRKALEESGLGEESRVEVGRLSVFWEPFRQKWVAATKDGVLRAIESTREAAIEAAVVETGAEPEYKKLRGTGKDLYKDVARRMGSDKAASEALFAAGIRGNKYLDGTSRAKGEGSYNYVVFDERDVEITARFALEPSPIRYSLVPREAFEDVNLPETTQREFDWWVRKVSDYLIPLQRLEEAIQERGGEIPNSVRLAAQLMPGKTQARVNAYMRRWESIADIMRQNDWWGGDWRSALALAGDVVYASHAPVRNKVGAERSQTEDGDTPWDPEMNPFSGMPDSEAAAITAEHGSKPGMQEIVTLVREMNTEVRDRMVEDGLIAQETADQWVEMFGDTYVPLRHEIDQDAPAHPRSRGFEVGGVMVYPMQGRRSRADNPLVYSFLQARNFAVTGEKNQVGATLWEVLQDPTNVGLVSFDEFERPDEAEFPEWQPPRNSFTFKDNGVERVIRMSSEDVNAALKGLTFVPATGLFRWTGAFNRNLGKLITQYNPEFGLANFARDIQAAMLNIAKEETEGARRRIIKGLPGSWRAIHRFERTGEHVDSEMGRMYQRFLTAGGLIGWAREVNFESLNEELTDTFRGVVMGVPMGTPGRFLRVVLDYMGHLNSAIEQGTRLSVFRAMVEGGKSDADAAKIAREITVDFNRRGEWASTMNAYKLFIGANIQGTAQLWRNMRHPAVRRMAGGIVGTSAALAFANYMFYGDDEDGENLWLKTEDHVKERNLVLPNPWSDDPADRFTIPAPYGFNVFHVLGTHITDSALRWGEGMTTKTEAVQDTVTALARASWNAFSPLTEESWMQMASPTVATPFVQVEMNETWFGGPIMPAKDQFGEEVPDAQRFFSSASKPSKALSQWLSELTGGSRFRTGGIDVSPETLDHLASSYTGGIGKFLLNLLNTAQQPQQSWPNDVPILRRFYSQRKGRIDVGIYRTNIDEVERVAKEAKHYRTPEERARFVEPRRNVLALSGLAKASEKRMRALNKLRGELRELEQTDEVQERLRSVEKQREALALRFNRAFYKADRQDRLGKTPSND